MLKTFLTVGLLSLLCGSAFAQNQSSNTQTENLIQSGLNPVYQKWLDETVAYIVTAEERRAFLLLKTNDERERFIERFWQMRNPDPSASENAYRVEYFRRVTTANRRFGSNVLPGWKTARGRLYITLGEPDEINKTSAREMWFYRHAGSLGNNVEIEFTSNLFTEEFHVRQRP